MRPLPFKYVRGHCGIWEPQACAIVMGECDPVAFRQEGKAPHAWRRRNGFYASGRIAGAHIFAARPSDRAVPPYGKRIDPSAFFLRNFLDSAICRDGNHAATVPSGNKLFSGSGGNEYRGARMCCNAHWALSRYEQHIAVVEGE